MRPFFFTACTQPYCAIWIVGGVVDPLCACSVSKLFVQTYNLIYWLQPSEIFFDAFIASLSDQNQLLVRVQLLESDYGVLIHQDKKFIVVLTP